MIGQTVGRSFLKYAYQKPENNIAVIAIGINQTPIVLTVIMVRNTIPDTKAAKPIVVSIPSNILFNNSISVILF